MKGKNFIRKQKRKKKKHQPVVLTRCSNQSSSDAHGSLLNISTSQQNGTKWEKESFLTSSRGVLSREPS